MRNSKIYQQVKEYLMQAISSGQMKVGEAIYSENKLCRILKVSRTSVRRAIRMMVAENVLESRQGVGTFVRTQSPPQTIALINYHTRSLRYTDLDHYYMGIIYGVERRASESNCRFEMYSSPIVKQEKVMPLTRHLEADGVVIDGNFQGVFKSLACFRNAFRACVVIDGNPQETRTASVVPDWESGYRELLTTLPPQGSILYVYDGSLPRRCWGKQCFFQILKELGIQYPALELDYTANVPSDLLHIVAREYLLFPRLDEIFHQKRFRHIFCGSDRTALQVLEYLKSRKYRIPEDVTLCGLGGVDFSEAVHPSLTTLYVNTEEMGSAAVDLLLTLLAGRQTSNCIPIPVRPLYRDSLC